MKIKVCGITTLHQLHALESLDVDYAGFIFSSASPRYAADTFRHEKTEVKNSPLKKIGVFVNENIDIVLETAEQFGLFAVQLHGDESAEYASEVNSTLPVIKVFRIGAQMPDLEMINSFHACSYYMFDTNAGTGSYGGTGKTFDWSLLAAMECNKPFFLSGGISKDHIEPLTSLNEKKPVYAVDINSRFETSPGIKDMKAVEEFISLLRSSSPMNKKK